MRLRRLHRTTGRLTWAATAKSQKAVKKTISVKAGRGTFTIKLPKKGSWKLAVSVTARGKTARAGGSEIARRTGVSGPAVSQLIAALSEAGLIERSTVAADRRRHALALSSAGRRTFRSAEALVRGRLSALLAEVPRPEAEALARLLPAVEAAVSGRPPPRRPPPPRPHHPRH